MGKYTNTDNWFKDDDLDDEDTVDDENPITFLNGCIKELAQMMTAMEEDSSEVDEEAVEEIKAIYEAICFSIADDDVTVTCRLHDPYPSTCCISITGESFLLGDPEIFRMIADRMQNMEVFLTNEGKIQMDITFHGLTNKKSL